MASLLRSCEGSKAAPTEAAVKPGELLLYWLSHVREGSWPAFRRALAAIQPEQDSVVTITAAQIMRRLSELAHADFFVDGSNRWQVYAPALGGLCEPSAAVLS